MKHTKYNILVAVAVLLALANNVLADPGGFDVPDAGSSMLLMSMALGGIAAARRFLGKNK